MMIVKYLNVMLLACLSMIGCQAIAQERTTSKSQSEELGEVSWYRDYDQALQKAKDENKAVLILFQEVPGCATCRNYGNNVLSHPLMVEAIEDLFIPLAIFNNKGGKDKVILQKYNEPSWNNPVVRIVDASGKDLVNRVAGNYSALGLYDAMEAALNRQRKTIPSFMRLLETELEAQKTGNVEEKVYKMYCFWSGEKHFGAAQGVLKTEAGFMGGHEVVKVTYDQKQISEQRLNQYASQAACSPIATSSNGKYRHSAKDQYYYLQNSTYRHLNLSEYQKMKINSALGNRQAVEPYLSPRQRKKARG